MIKELQEWYIRVTSPQQVNLDKAFQNLDHTLEDIINSAAPKKVKLNNSEEDCRGTISKSS